MKLRQMLIETVTPRIKQFSPKGFPELQFEEIVPEYKFYVEDFDGTEIGKTMTMKESIDLFLERHPNFDLKSIETFIHEIK